MPFNKKFFDAARQAVHDHEIGATPAFDGGARVVVLRDDAETESKGGLIIPEQAQKRKSTGTVVAVSEQGDKARYTATVAVGKRASFNAYDGSIHSIPVIIDGEPSALEVIVLHISALYLTWRSPDLVIASHEGTEREA